jgi:GT2 family glycosyltransferase
VLFPDAAAALYRRAMLDEVGVFDESFFAYGDDADVGLRGRLAGWTCRYVPSAVVYHIHSATAGEFSALKAFLIERNRLFVAVKLFPHLLFRHASSPPYALPPRLWRTFLTAIRHLRHTSAALLSPSCGLGSGPASPWHGRLAANPRLREISDTDFINS